MSKIINLFSSNIYKTKINPNSYDKDIILQNIYTNLDKQKNRDVKKSFGKLHHSYADFENKNFVEINYDKLIPIYNNIFKDFFEKNIDSKFTYEWGYEIVNYTATIKDHYMNKHWHLPDYDFSSIHYVSFDKSMPRTKFYNPNQMLSKSLRIIRPDLNEGLNLDNYNNSIFCKSYELTVEEDEIIIFPSFLEHSIPSSEKEYNKPRVTIVCNLKYNLKKENKNV
jgi:hypothetical protein